MMWLPRRRSFFSLSEIGIETPIWEEYDAEDQLEENVYEIGILKTKLERTSFVPHEYKEVKVVEGKANQVKYIEDLYRRFGSNSTIIIQEVLDYVIKGTLTIKIDDAEIDKTIIDPTAEFTEDDDITITGWIVKLSSNFDWSDGNIIKLSWGKTVDGRLLVTQTF